MGVFAQGRVKKGPKYFFAKHILNKSMQRCFVKKVWMRKTVKVMMGIRKEG